MPGSPCPRSAIPISAPSEPSIVIVGLGPVGALLANLLGARGVSVTVYERHAGPRAEPRAAHLDDDAMRILQSAGVAEAIAAGGRTIDGMEIVDSRGRRLLRARKRVDGAAPMGWPAATLVHQPDVEKALRAGLSRYPTVEVRAGHNVQGIEPDETGVTLHVRQADGDYADRAAWVVGCDGAHSTVRTTMNAEMRPAGRPFRERWLVVDTLLRESLDLPTELTQFADADRPATYVPFAGARRRWEFRLHRGEDATAMTSAQSVARLLSAHVDPSALDVERSAVYTFSSAVARPWRRGPLLLAGDAAHIMPPFIGQGLCSGLRDAAFLGWALASVVRDGASPTILDAYEQERAPHAAAAVRLSVRAGRFIGVGQPFGALRDGLLAAARRSPRLKRRLDNVGVGGPVLRATIAGAGGQTLRQVPQPAVETFAGEHALLDDVLGPSWCALGFGLEPRVWAGRADVWSRLDCRFVRVLSPHEEQASEAAVRDTSTVLTQWAGATGGRPVAIVIRPDRYLFGRYDADGGEKAAAELRVGLGYV